MSHFKLIKIQFARYPTAVVQALKNEGLAAPIGHRSVFMRAAKTIMTII